MVDDADDILELAGRLDGVGDRLLEEEVDDVVAVVGHGRLVTVDLIVRGGAKAQAWFAPGERGQARDRAHRALGAEGCDFDGQGERRSQPAE